MTPTRWILLIALALPLAAGAQGRRGQQQQQQAQQPAQQQQEQEPEKPRLTFEQLLQQVEALREEERRIAQQREAAVRAELQRQEAAAREQEQRRDRAEARSEELNRQWDANDARINELNELLAQSQGYLGELFGVTRQVAGDAANVLQQSMLTAQYAPTAEGEERVEFLRRLAGARALPSITELERMWFELMREMVDAAKVQRFQANILQDDLSTVEQAEVVRVGPFTAVSNGEFLGYLTSRKMFTVLEGRLPAQFRTIARDLQNTPEGSGHVTAVADPSRGALLGLYVERPGWIERIERGEAVGYVIITVGLIGLAVALIQYVYLIFTRFAVARQLRDMSTPRTDNPLGRVLIAFRNGLRPGESRELAELRLSEAVLREMPKLERFQSFLRLAVAAGPLLGLIGTVIGMIITFKAITAAGSSDPRLMAQGIGQAMIATVLGLGIAIPLLFINAGLAALSRGITHILDEHTHELLAEQGRQQS
ncbi:MAG TPA: MotA/TolQ/ExbB proton channel family protein [Gammaproteobacteria bacterium]